MDYQFLKIHDPKFVDRFTAAYGARQVGVINLGNGINPIPFAVDAILEGMIPINCGDHIRLYRAKGE